MVDARGEEQGVGRSGIGTVAERQAPQAADLDGFPADVHELAGGREFVRPTLRELEGIDPAVAEIADQEVATVLPKLLGARAMPQGELSVPRDATRWIKLPLVSKTSTKPWPLPATSSCLSASCLA